MEWESQNEEGDAGHGLEGEIREADTDEEL
jgi:hypothetical protein